MISRSDGEHEPDNPARADYGLPPNHPPIIGLAGGIGSGKSAVARALEQLGCLVSYADAAVREILATDTAVRDQLVEWWGNDVLTEPGDLDRAAIARIVFANDEDRQRLEELLHPLVHRRRKDEWSRALEAGGDLNKAAKIRALVIDAPLLFEAGLDTGCDAVVFVDVPRETRLRRVRETRGWDESELDRREKTQWSLDTKREQSDYVIRNDASLETLMENVATLLDTITRDTPGETGKA